MKKIIISLCFVLFVFGCTHPETNINNEVKNTKYTPEWAQDLIIYEIAPKSFTSPNGSGTGTFNSTKEKMTYLADLGINGIWLTGHNWANNHFYNIWTQYACIRQDSIDPSLGTPQDFKALIDEAHAQDIKIFLDVITHGVVNGSPLIDEHPEWFTKGSWGMTDFDWFGGHADLDKWWVDTWLSYVLDYGVDGFRIDCDIYRPDLWNEIRKKAKEKGKEIVIFAETPLRYPGMSDSRQYVVNIASHGGLVKDHQFVNNPAGHLNTLFNFGKNDYQIEISLQDTAPVLITSKDSRVVSIEHLEKEITGEEFMPYCYYTTVIKILCENMHDSLVGVKITQFEEGFNHYEQNWWAWNREVHHPNEAHCKISGDTIIACFPEIPPNEELTFLQISCHDGGWEGFPEDENPYSVQGSRCVIGYSGLLTPTVPILFMGEEFNANYHALPEHKGSLYGDKGKEGDGRWMYAATLDWKELEAEKHRNMFNDVKKIINIRKENSDLFSGCSLQSNVKILALKYECAEDIPVPFIIWNNDKAVVVVGNNLPQDIELKITIPEEVLPFAPIAVEDLWLGNKVEYSKEIILQVKADKTPQGGLAILKIHQD